MAEFIAINKNVEVNKQTVLSVVNSMDKGKETRLSILVDNGINPEEKEWFNQQKWLNAFKDIAVKLGDMNLFLIGKAIIDNAEFPPIKDLKEALMSIDVAYHMNHRLDSTIMFDSNTGKITEGIGHYKLAEFNEKERKAIMICNNPYPSKFDEGIITQLVRKYRPKMARETIQLDKSKETRKTGSDSCTYIITW